MALTSLDNLVRGGQLKAEPTAQSELDGLIRSGLARLNDAENKALSLDSRFDLAYNAAHALSLAALRWHGYRSDNRQFKVAELHLPRVIESLQGSLDTP
jgi:hypothetical protein